jgi:hypothetical protein
LRSFLTNKIYKKLFNHASAFRRFSASIFRVATLCLARFGQITSNMDEIVQIVKRAGVTKFTRTTVHDMWCMVDDDNSKAGKEVKMEVLRQILPLAKSSRVPTSWRKKVLSGKPFTPKEKQFADAWFEWLESHVPLPRARAAPDVAVPAPAVLPVRPQALADQNPTQNPVIPVSASVASAASRCDPPAPRPKSRDTPRRGSMAAAPQTRQLVSAAIPQEEEKLGFDHPCLRARVREQPVNAGWYRDRFGRLVSRNGGRGKKGFQF